MQTANVRDPLVRPQPRRSPRPDSARLRTVLFLSDLGEVSDAAFAHVRLLVEHFGARLAMCHLVDRHHFHGRGRAEMLRRALDRGLDHLAVLADGMTGPVDYHVEPADDLGARLVGYVRETEPDLTVMATRGHGAVARVLLGSLSADVLSGADRPVLVVREPAHGVALPYRRVMLPTDLTLDSRRALPWASLLARGFGAQVVVVHVSPPGNGFSLAGVTERVEEAPTADRLLEFVGPALAGLDVVTRLLQGPPEEELVRVAGRERCDVMVLASHGLDSVQDALHGTLTERLARHAPCPVLAV